jgi:hypothetical protein
MRLNGESTVNSRLFKRWLTQIGEHVSSKTIFNLNAAVNYLELGRWMRANGYEVRRRLDRREQLFDLVGSEVAGREVLYMEFGVWQGEATRYWSGLLRNPKSKLHGFDSFGGLPENWGLAGGKGCFSVDGKLPETNDPRVRFFKGLFEKTLPLYEFPPHDVLVLNFDADLYSSTRFALASVRDVILPGSYLYFDEFNQRTDEMRAFHEFTEESGMKFNLLGATHTFEHVLFQRQ